jgi:hypothetical protein
MFNTASHMDMYSRAKVTVAGHTIIFETNCLPAYQYLRELSDVSFLPYQFEDINDALGGTTLRYDHRPDYSCSYDDERDTLEASFPWDTLSHNIIRALLWHIFELQRQRTGEYAFHASAVVRDGFAVVLTGPAESGKTIIALDLCLKYGFDFYANDVVIMRAQEETPHLLFGDLTIRLRLSSLQEYDAELAARLFGHPGGGTDLWDIKRNVVPKNLGIGSTSGLVPILQLAFVQLDKYSKVLHAKSFDWSDSNRQRYFHNEMAANIRGGIYAPVQEVRNLVPLFIPSLDRPSLFSKRLAFMEDMADHCKLHTLRGRLQDITAHISGEHRNKA